jgi:2'-5' RNA ligase
MIKQPSFAELGVAPPKHRVFFAIFPDADAATKIAQLARHLRDEQGLKGAPLATERFHVTLHHLGDYEGLPQGVVAAACEAAVAVAMPPFDVAFDRVVSFAGRLGKKPFVLCGGEGVAILMEFQQALGVAMKKAGLARWAKPRYTPHVTLVYDDGHVAEQPVETIAWTVNEFVLVHSLLGQTRHIPLARWSLPGSSGKGRSMPSEVVVDPPDGYVALLSDLKRRIRAARLQAALAVNQELILLYWDIGRDVLARQEMEGWGTRIIDRLAADLRRDFPEMTGLSSRNIKYMRAFAAAYTEREFVQQVVAQLPWGHNIRLVESVKDADQRLWYAQQAIEHGWSRNVLAHQIDSGLFRRQGKAMTNFVRTLPRRQSELAQQLIKDPYNFDFLSLGADMLERDLERGLIEHLGSLILELGKGFAFVGSQHHLEVGGQDYYLDLLFYHYRLRCFVVIELKIEEFKPEFTGKMNFYLSAVDDQLRQSSDGPSIGIILCQGRNEIIVEYALRDSTKPMGVATYRLSPPLPEPLRSQLPTTEEFAREFPLLSVVKLRIEVERAVRSLMALHGIEIVWPMGVRQALRELQSRGVAPASTDAFLQALRAMNEAAHGLDVEPAAVEQATRIGSEFLAELRSLGAE